MSLREKYLKILSRVIPAGAMGASLLLGSTAPGSANDHPNGLQPSASDEARVSERLAAVREAVSVLVEPKNSATSIRQTLQLAWGNRWNRGWGARRGWGWPNWNNWRNGPARWNNWWRNW
jgi:hypothetical protein